jgi:hypothetical protein
VREVGLARMLDVVGSNLAEKIEHSLKLGIHRQVLAG